MPNDGTGDMWNIAAPADGDALSGGAKEIRDIRIGVGIRMDKEHVALATGGAGGEHLAGSAKVFYQASAPTKRPDTATSFTADDYGRIFIDSTTKEAYVYTASGFVKIATTTFIASGVTVTALADDAVETLKIKDKNVTVAKLEDVLDLSTKTVTLGAATMSDFTNATHSHTSDATGGTSGIGRFASGTYTGDGTTNSSKKITVGFPPKFVWVTCTSTDYNGFMKMNDMTGSYAKIPPFNAYTNNVCSFGADGDVDKFIVLNTSNGNTNGVAYSWIAVG